MKKILGLIIAGSFMMNISYAQVPSMDQATKAASDAKAQAKQNVSNTKVAVKADAAKQVSNGKDAVNKAKATKDVKVAAATKLKKDGTADMRFKANKEAANAKAQSDKSKAQAKAKLDEAKAKKAAAKEKIKEGSKDLPLKAKMEAAKAKDEVKKG